LSQKAGFSPRDGLNADLRVLCVMPKMACSPGHPTSEPWLPLSPATDASAARGVTYHQKDD